MPDINVILPDGSEKTYYNVETVTYDSATEGETETFIHETLIPEAYTHPDTHPADMITGLSKVATSGNYADLKGKVVGDACAISEDVYDFVDEDGLMVHVFDEPLDVVKGETYKVVWDDSEYICECKDTVDLDGFGEQSNLYLGNIHIIAPVENVPDTTEPFMVIVSGNSIITSDTEATHRVGITPVNSIIKLDSKYLPDNLATQEWVQEEIGNIEVSGGSGDVGDSPIPSFTASDEGKFLGVKDGELSWETVASFGGSTKEIDIIPSQEFTFFPDTVPVDENTVFIHEEADDTGENENVQNCLKLKVGSTYTVDYNNTAYECVAIDVSDLASSMGAAGHVIAIGNVSMIDADTNDTKEPFVIMVFDLSYDDDGTTYSHTAIMISIKHGENADMITRTIRVYERVTDSGTSSDLLETVDAPLALLHRNTTTFVYDSGFGIYLYGVSISEDQYNKWNTYDGLVNVYLDGETYNVSIQDVVFQGMPLKAAGGLSMLGGSGTEPFMACAMQTAQNIYVMGVTCFDTEAVEHTVQVSLSNTETKLDNKYLPDIPLFDLTAMGLPVFSDTNLSAAQTIDGTAIRAAARNGMVKLAFSYAGYVYEMPALFTFMPGASVYTYSNILKINNGGFLASFEIDLDAIRVNITPMTF